MLDAILKSNAAVRMNVWARFPLQRCIVAWLIAVCAPCAHARVLHPLPGQYERPPEAISALLEAAPLPAVALAPGGRHLILVHESGLLPLERLAAPMLELGNFRVDPSTHGPHTPTHYAGFTVVDIASMAKTTVALPAGATVSYPLWSPDGTKFAFTLTTRTGIELWLADPVSAHARKLVDSRLNSTTGSPCSWMPDGERLLCRTVLNATSQDDPLFRHIAATPATWGYGGFALPTAQSTTPARVLEAQLELIEADSGMRRPVGSAAAFIDVEPSPNGAFLLVARLDDPYVVPGGTAPRLTEVWKVTESGVDVQSFVIGATPRALHWHPSEPATLVWAERSETRDRLLAVSAPFIDEPVELFGTPHQFAGIDWLEDSPVALVREYNSATRATALWRIDSRHPGAANLLANQSVDARFAPFGLPATRLNRQGHHVVIRDERKIYIAGEESLGHGVRNYLDRFDLQSGIRERVWQSGSTGYERVVEILSTDATTLLIRRESAREPPNYFVRELGSESQEALTENRHPAPSLLEVQRVALRYMRKDGYGLTSTLYLPPGATVDSPLPVVIWAYPRQFGAEVRSLGGPSSDRFIDFNRAFKLFFLLSGYAVMDDVSMPVIGDGNEANDTFVVQVIENMRSAIDAAADTGYVDRQRVGVAGHSYGAFMVANLLAHSDLFRAGVAMSGAYNRTLTPFGFQTEHRTLWEAMDTYLAMSPLLYSDRISAPLLLVHGQLDANAGTHPLQSQQLYEAIRHNGGQTELLLLPWEGHTYRSREAVFQTASSMLGWFDRYLKPQTPVSAEASAVLVHSGM